MGVAELQRRIESSHLSAEDKDMWLHALEMMDDEQAQEILESLDGDERDLDDMTRNIKVKRIALAQGDGALLNQILASEEDAIVNT
ncbi:MAG: hypothetical protein IT406_04130 [Candidatus Yanofskybacteria bacterium]|nr:hypothetical protein [Candidatus Yanofskybacteria bacterium]